MSPTKRLRRHLDLYAECNVEPRAPLDVFTAECCSQCVNPECTRSNFGNTKFEARVSQWYERLFADVPRMSAADERYAKIAGQRFMLIDPVGSTPSQEWVDPRNLVSSRPRSIRKPPSKPQQEPPVVPAALEPESDVPKAPSETLSEEESAPVEKPSSAGAELALVNTPVTQGQMLGGRPPPTPSEWRVSVAVAPSPQDKVVKAGAKIKLGS